MVTSFRRAGALALVVPLLGASLLAQQGASASEESSGLVQTDTRSGPSSITATWLIPDDPAPIEGYKVRYGTSPDELTRTEDVGLDTHATIRGVRNGETYYMQVVAYGPDGEELDESNVMTARPLVPNTRVVTDGFDDGDLDGWTVESGTWNADSGSLDGNGVIVTGAESLNEYSVQAQVDAGDAGAQNGLITRYRDGGNYYSFVIDANNDRARLYRTVDGSTSQLVHRYYPVEANTAYTLELVASDYELRGYIDGKQVLLASDVEFATGRAGVVASHDTSVDNVVVKTIPPTPSRPDPKRDAPADVVDNEWRQSQLLSGWWNFEPENGEKTNMRVPDCWACVSTNTGTKGTYQRYFDVPTDFGERVVLEFDQVTERATVHLNGELVGTHKGEGIPFSFDITDQVDRDGTNLLTVVAERGDKFYPHGWRDRNVDLGIRGDVWLRSYPDVFISDVLVKPSVADGEVEFVTTVTNTSQDEQTVAVHNSVTHDGVPAKSFAPEPGVTVPAGETTTVAFTRAWDDAHLWSPADPYLYRLESALVAGDDTVDVNGDVRFGFRELTTVGTGYQLNGVPFTLLADSVVSHGPRMSLESQGSHPQDYYLHWGTKARAVETMNLYQEKLNVNALRTHMGPATTKAFYEAADETGMLIIDESAIYGSSGENGVPGGTDDDGNTGLETFTRWIRAWITSNYNHPSIVHWSLSNEAEHLGDAVRIDLHETAKSLDDRIASHSHGGPDAASDVVVKHYTNPASHNEPGVGIGCEGRGVPNIWTLDTYSSTKPSGQGEFAWALGTITESLALLTRGYRYAGFAEIRPYRLTSHVNDLMLPFQQYSNYIDQMKKSMNPVAVFDKGYDRYGFAPEELPALTAGDVVHRRLIVFNDELAGTAVDVNWTARIGETVVADGSVSKEIALGDYTEFDVTFTVPTGATGSDLTFEFGSSKDGEVRFRDERHFSITDPGDEPAAETFVIDDDNVNNECGQFRASANWEMGTDGGHGGQYRHGLHSTGRKWAVWEPGVSGTFTVYYHWLADESNASNAEIRVYHADGEHSAAGGKYDILLSDMREGAAEGEFHELGTFTMGDTDYVGVVTDGADGRVIADAVKFVRVDD